MAGPGGGRYLAHGTATDYMFQELGVPLAFTWEIYGDDKAGYSECFRMFNPSGKQVPPSAPPRIALFLRGPGRLRSLCLLQSASLPGAHVM